MSSIISKDSPSIYLKQTLTLLHSLLSFGPFKMTSLIFKSSSMSLSLSTFIFSLSSSLEISTAFANPTIPGTFSVPALKPDSCPPPSISLTIFFFRSFLTYSTPMPFGPCILCPENDAREILSCFTSMSSFNKLCTASVCKGTFFSEHISPIFATSCTTPISLFECITDTMQVSSSIFSFSCSMSTKPSLSTFR